MNILLCGFKSCGKTYFGSRLAHRIPAPFLDTDTLLEKHYFNSFGKNLSCREICLEIGEAGFRNLEKKILFQLEDIKKSVIAFGGGAILHFSKETLMRLGKVIYLETDKAILKKRLLVPPLPSFLDGEEGFNKMYEERLPFYKKLSEDTICLNNKSDDEVLKELWEAIPSEIFSKSQHGENRMEKPLAS